MRSLIIHWRDLSLSYSVLSNIRRYISKSSAFCVSKKYSDTLNLPKFPARFQERNISKRECDIQKICGFDDLYQWQRLQNRDKEFVLHDGPPYANGKPHVGHVHNKVLKDITNRYKLLRGYKIHYVPGWDCHGLPIELKAQTASGKTFEGLNPMEIRQKAKEYAEGEMKIQMDAFKRWGVMADWDNCYVTINKKYEANELEMFYSMYQKGYVYQDYMPVYWSTSSRTALAEAELEYNPDHVSTAAYVKFPLTELSPALRQIVGDDAAYAVIWTTTPWTLPANKAICYGNNMKYVVSRHVPSSCLYLCAEDHVEKLSTLLGGKVESVAVLEGSGLAETKYRQPLSEEELPFLAADHVTSGKGTGLVHSAPAHGHDDFKVALKHGIIVDCFVDEDGIYTKDAGPLLEGKQIGNDADETVLRLFGDYILGTEKFSHSFPYDWRTKLPVFIRASKQWFINMDQLRNKAMDCMKDVNVIPKTLENIMINDLKSRPHWCISRQRVWGFPIPVFYEKKSGKPLINRRTIDHLKQLIETHGSDCWWSLPLSELLPNKILQELHAGVVEDYERGEDIIDIWFDSGVSWKSVLKDVSHQADVYLEGGDQFRGWFQSSLITSAAIMGQAPYKNLVVHGFAVNEDGQKMSKSVGNIIDPAIIIEGGKDTKRQPVYGADILRWWSVSGHIGDNIHIGPTVLETCKEEVQKIRGSLRFLVGNLYDFDPEDDLMLYDDLLPQDQYMLHCLHDYGQQVTNFYEDFQFRKVLWHTFKFVNVLVSKFYSRNIKDRLYCELAESKARRSCQSVLHHLFSILNLSLAPVVPHLVEDNYQSYPPTLSESGIRSIFKTSWFTLNPEWNNPPTSILFDKVFHIEDTFNAAIGSKDPLKFDLIICASEKLYQDLKTLHPEEKSTVSPLCELLHASITTLVNELPSNLPENAEIVHGEIHSDRVTYSLVLLEAGSHLCERCRRYTAENRNEPCSRCVEVMAGVWAA